MAVQRPGHGNVIVPPLKLIPLDNDIMSRRASLILAFIAVCLIIPFLIGSKRNLKQLIGPFLQDREISATVPAVRVRLRIDPKFESNGPYVVSIIDSRGVESPSFPFTNIAPPLSLLPHNDLLLDSYSANYGFTESKVFGIIPLEDAPKPWRDYFVSVKQNHKIVAIVPCEDIFSQAEVTGRPSTITTTVIHDRDNGLSDAAENSFEASVREIVCTIEVDPVSKSQRSVRGVGSFYFQAVED